MLAILILGHRGSCDCQRYSNKNDRGLILQKRERDMLLLASANAFVFLLRIPNKKEEKVDVDVPAWNFREPF